MKKKLIILMVVVIGVLLLLFLSSCQYETIVQMEFDSLDDVELGFTILFEIGDDYTGSILVSPENFDKNNIEIISDNPKIVDISLGSKYDGKVNYTVTAKYNGIVNIFAQTKDGSVRTSSKKFILSGGSDPHYTTEEQNLVYIKSAIQVDNNQAVEIMNTLQKIGFNAIDDASFGWEENGIDTLLVTCDGLVVDIDIKGGITQKISVNANDNNVTPTLVLYDINQNGFIRTITAEEIKTFLTKQEIAKKAFVEEQVRSIITLKKFSRTSPNSAGGVSINITLKNNSSKTIKYVYMSFYALNAVEDEVYCTIRGEGERILKMTGPISPGATDSGYADCYWYNTSIAKQGFNYFEIEYMDGTSVVFTPEMRSALIRNMQT